MNTTPDLPMHFEPVFDLDISRADEWPMPPIKAWPFEVPSEKQLSEMKAMADILDDVDRLTQEACGIDSPVLATLCEKQWNTRQFESFADDYGRSLVAVLAGHQCDLNQQLLAYAEYREGWTPPPKETNLFMRIIFGIFK